MSPPFPDTTPVSNDDHSDSCLVSYLSAYADLSETDNELIARLERDEREFPAESVVQARGDRVEELYVVKRGWLYSSTDLLDGRRHIVRTHHAGDVLGLGDLAEPRAATTLTCCTEVLLCPFPKEALGRVFRDSPRLAALLLALSARDQVLLYDLLRATARMSARERVVFLLLSLLHRLRVTNRSMDDTFSLRLTQVQIGDLLGLTNVSVSKALVELESEGAIDRHRQEVTLKDVPALIERVEFVDRFSKLDTAWFPLNTDTGVYR